MTNGLQLAAFGLITALIILFAGDSPLRYAFAAVTAIAALGALPGLLFLIRLALRFGFKHRTGE